MYLITAADLHIKIHYYSFINTRSGTATGARTPAETCGYFLLANSCTTWLPWRCCLTVRRTLSVTTRATQKTLCGELSMECCDRANRLEQPGNNMAFLQYGHSSITRIGGVRPTGWQGPEVSGTCAYLEHRISANIVRVRHGRIGSGRDISGLFSIGKCEIMPKCE